MKDLIELFNENHNLNIEISVGNAIASKFPYITHMITLNYDGENLQIEFLDPDCDYKEEVSLFIQNLKLIGTI